MCDEPSVYMKVLVALDRLIVSIGGTEEVVDKGEAEAGAAVAIACSRASGVHLRGSIPCKFTRDGFPKDVAYARSLIMLASLKGNEGEEEEREEENRETVQR